MMRLADMDMTLAQIAAFTGLNQREVERLMGTPEGPKSRRMVDVAAWWQDREEGPAPALALAGKRGR